MTDEDKARLDLFKFLVDKGFAEATLFYTRSTVFFGLQLAFVGFFLSTIVKEYKPADSSAGMVYLSLLLTCGLGFAVNVAWFFVNARSIAYNRSWLRDAIRLCDEDNFLKQWVQSALKNPGMTSPALSRIVSEAGERQEKKQKSLLNRSGRLVIKLVCFWGWPASWWFQILVVVFAVCWAAGAFFLPKPCLAA